MNRPSLALREIIAASGWVATLTPEQRARVEVDTFCRPVEKNAVACRRGEPAQYWMCIVEGLVKVSIGYPDGKITTYAPLAKGAWFGEGALLKEARWYDVITLRHTQIAYLPRATFLWLLDHNIQFNRYILKLLVERYCHFFALVEYDRMLDATSRVAQSLASLLNPALNFGITSCIDISQEEIGNLIGASRQQVCKALKPIVDAGLVRLERYGIKVLDVEGLKQFRKPRATDDCYRAQGPTGTDP